MRIATTVSRTAVGWCAKSSITVTPRDFAAHFLAAAHAAEARERGRRFLHRHAERHGGRERAECIRHVVAPVERDHGARDLVLVAQYAERGAGRPRVEIDGAKAVLAVADAVADHLARRSLEHVADVLVVERRDDRPVRRHARAPACGRPASRGRGRGRCPRDRTRPSRRAASAGGSARTSASCRRRPCRTRRLRRRSAGRRLRGRGRRNRARCRRPAPTGRAPSRRARRRADSSSWSCRACPRPRPSVARPSPTRRVHRETSGAGCRLRRPPAPPDCRRAPRCRSRPDRDAATARSSHRSPARPGCPSAPAHRSSADRARDRIR